MSLRPLWDLVKLYSKDDSLESALKICKIESESSGDVLPMILGVKTDDGCKVLDLSDGVVGLNVDTESVSLYIEEQVSRSATGCTLIPIAGCERAFVPQLDSFHHHPGGNCQFCPLPQKRPV